MSNIDNQVASSDEVQYINVSNISLRLVHIGGVMIPPGQSVPLVDDPEGINRQMVEDEECLELTEDVQQNIPKKESKAKSAAKSATGAGWSAKN